MYLYGMLSVKGMGNTTLSIMKQSKRPGLSASSPCLNINYL